MRCADVLGGMVICGETTKVCVAGMDTMKCYGMVCKDGDAGGVYIMV